MTETSTSSRAEPLVPRLVKAKQAAQYLNISTWKLRNLVQEGRIPYIPGEGTAPWLFDRRDLDQYVEKAKVVF